MAYIPTQLRDVADRLISGDSVSVDSVKTVLGWYAAQRRSPHVLRQINEALLELGLTTVPDFESAFIDGPIEFLTAPQAAGSVRAEATSAPDVRATSPQSAATDPTFRVGRLASANRSPVGVAPTDSIEYATTLMMELDYSQLPVMQSKRAVKGMVSWQSIGSALALGYNCTNVTACMIPYHAVASNSSLFSAIPKIIEHDYVLVFDATGKMTGIITVADLSEQFMQLSEPFLLLREIENHLRRLIDFRVPPQAVQLAKNPNDLDREIDSAADLTFGEYSRVFEQAGVWPQLRLNIDRKLFLGRLEEIRRIRNDVMHFDPDGIAPADEKRLRDFVNLLQVLARYGVL